ncbi:MAG: sigma factor-like helix-turn-helix DNA-binding protein [Eubacteriales bacterium]|nr:DNA-binding protein [Eubacteriales bacterium]MCI6972048.1 hypothetical protein [Eubacterium sp.]MDD7572785.1 sigma factor-like helix-turn-helix DNA-binding protein [Eubacteriales bacterium]MDY5354947.1 sigma factor-like helix-turn-helix DNA-binding protein [Eubacteriales bacterium]
MAEKDLSLTILFDIYGGLLSANEKDAFEYYYCDDLSLSEIAEIMKMTRQGVRDNIVRAEKLLRDCEEKLGLKKKFSETERLLSIAKNALASGNIRLAEETLDMLKL